MRDTPMITLRLEGLGRTITAAFADYADDVQKQVTALVEEEIKAFDFAAIVRQEARAALADATKRAVVSHFTYGEGHRAIEEAVARMMPKYDAP